MECRRRGELGVPVQRRRRRRRRGGQRRQRLSQVVREGGRLGGRRAGVYVREVFCGGHLEFDAERTGAGWTVDVMQAGGQPVTLAIGGKVIK